MPQNMLITGKQKEETRAPEQRARAAESTDALHCFIMNEYKFQGSVWNSACQSVFPNEPLNVYGKYNGL